MEIQINLIALMKYANFSSTIGAVKSNIRPQVKLDTTHGLIQGLISCLVNSLVGTAGHRACYSDDLGTSKYKFVRGG